MSGPTKAQLLEENADLKAEVARQALQIENLPQYFAAIEGLQQRVRDFEAYLLPNAAETPAPKPHKPRPVVAVDTGPRFAGDSHTPKGVTEMDPR